MPEGDFQHELAKTCTLTSSTNVNINAGATSLG